MFIGRFLMRLLLMPLGGGVAICVATLFVMVAQWNRMAALTADDYSVLLTFFVLDPVLSVGSWIMPLPAPHAPLLQTIMTGTQLPPSSINDYARRRGAMRPAGERPFRRSTASSPKTRCPLSTRSGRWRAPDWLRRTEPVW